MPLSPENLFVRAGFAGVDGRVYDALSTKEGASIAELCRASGLHRPTVYRSLARLEKASLLKRAKKGKRFVSSPADPEILKKILTRADKENAAATKKFIAAIPRNENVTVLRGPSGLATVLDELVRSLGKDDIFYRISSRKPSTNIEGFIPKDFRRMRDAKKLQQFVLCNAALRAAPHKKRIDGLSKVLPEDGDPFEYDIALVIYGDNVATVDYAGQQAVIIRNPQLAKFHARLFKMLFDRL